MIYIGDRVRVKTWEQMEEEFGTETMQVGDEKEVIIDCEGYFTKGMTDFCGTEFVVSDVKTDGTFKFLDTTTVFPIERLYGLELADKYDIVITEDMVEVV